MEMGVEFGMRHRKEIGVLFVFKISVHQLDSTCAPFNLEIFQKSNKSPKLSLIRKDLQHRELEEKKFFQAPPFFLSPSMTSRKSLII